MFRNRKYVQKIYLKHDFRNYVSHASFTLAFYTSGKFNEKCLKGRDPTYIKIPNLCFSRSIS